MWESDESGIVGDPYMGYIWFDENIVSQIISTFTGVWCTVTGYWNQIGNQSNYIHVTVRALDCTNPNWSYRYGADVLNRKAAQPGSATNFTMTSDKKPFSGDHTLGKLTMNSTTSKQYYTDGYAINMSKYKSVRDFRIDSCNIYFYYFSIRIVPMQLIDSRGIIS